MKKTNYKISALSQSHILKACTKNNISHLFKLSKLDESLKQLVSKVNLDKIEQHVPVRNRTLNLKVNSNFQGAHTLMGSRFKSHKELKQLYSMWRKLKSDKYDTLYLDLCFTEQEEYIPPDSVKKYGYIFNFLFHNYPNITNFVLRLTIGDNVNGDRLKINLDIFKAIMSKKIRKVMFDCDPNKISALFLENCQMYYDTLLHVSFPSTQKLFIQIHITNREYYEFIDEDFAILNLLSSLDKCAIELTGTSNSNFNSMVDYVNRAKVVSEKPNFRLCFDGYMYTLHKLGELLGHSNIQIYLKCDIFEFFNVENQRRLKPMLNTIECLTLRVSDLIESPIQFFQSTNTTNIINPDASEPLNNNLIYGISDTTMRIQELTNLKVVNFYQESKGYANPKMLSLTKKMFFKLPDTITTLTLENSNYSFENESNQLYEAFPTLKALKLKYSKSVMYESHNTDYFMNFKCLTQLALNCIGPKQFNFLPTLKSLQISCFSYHDCKTLNEYYEKINSKSFQISCHCHLRIETFKSRIVTFERFKPLKYLHLSNLANDIASCRITSPIQSFTYSI